MLAQVNQLRECFGKNPKWKDAENNVKIKETVFKHGIGRGELKGEL